MSGNLKNINDLISGKGFIMVNKGLAKEVGLLASTIYGELVSTYSYWESKQQLTERDGKLWFFCTIADLEDKTTIKEESQRTAINKLVRNGLIEMKRFGLPAKRYFHITDKYISILLNNHNDTEDSKNSDSGDDSNKISEKDPSNQRGCQTHENTGTGQGKNKEQHQRKNGTNNKELNNKQFNKDDDDIYRHQKKSEFYNPIKNYLQKNGISEITTIKIIAEMDNQNISNWKSTDIEKQLQHMLKEIQGGVKYTHFHTYFINGLKNIIEQRTFTEMNDSPTAPTEQQQQPRKRDNSIYYDWTNA